MFQESNLNANKGHEKSISPTRKDNSLNRIDQWGTENSRITKGKLPSLIDIINEASQMNFGNNPMSNLDNSELLEKSNYLSGDPNKSFQAS